MRRKYIHGNKAVWSKDAGNSHLDRSSSCLEGSAERHAKESVKRGGNSSTAQSKNPIKSEREAKNDERS